MILFVRNRPGKLVVTVLSLLIILVVFLLHTTQGSISSGRLSESLEIINRCPPRTIETPNYSDGDTGVPNIIHQIWRTTDVRTYSTTLKASQDSWKTMFQHNNYTVKLWTDDDVLELLMANYTWLLSTYKNYPYNIQRADLARLVILYAEGGIYADLDVYPHELTQIQCLQHLGLQTIFASTTGTLGLSNHFFMAERESLFLQWALYEAKRRGAAESLRVLIPYLQVFWTTGPMMVTAAFREYAWLYSSQRQNIGLLDESYGHTVIHHAAGRSWHGSDGKILNYMADHVQMTVSIGVFSPIILLGLIYVVRSRMKQ